MSLSLFPLSKNIFEYLDIPNLLINVREYNDISHPNSEICQQYEKWCIEVLQSKWEPEFKSLDFVISQIRSQNKQFCNFGNYSIQHRNLIYYKIYN